MTFCKAPCSWTRHFYYSHRAVGKISHCFMLWIETGIRHGKILYSFDLLFNYFPVILDSQSSTVSRVDDSPQGAGGALSKRLRMYKCERCNTQYMGLAMLRQHCRDVHGDQKYYKCHVCGKLFSHPSSRNIHLRLHSGEKPYKCTTCGKQFRVSSHLKDHVRVHTGKFEFCR